MTRCQHPAHMGLQLGRGRLPAPLSRIRSGCKILAGLCCGLCCSLWRGFLRGGFGNLLQRGFQLVQKFGHLGRYCPVAIALDQQHLRALVAFGYFVQNGALKTAKRVLHRINPRLQGLGLCLAQPGLNGLWLIFGLIFGLICSLTLCRGFILRPAGSRCRLARRGTLDLCRILSIQFELRLTGGLDRQLHLNAIAAKEDAEVFHQPGRRVGPAGQFDQLAIHRQAAITGFLRLHALDLFDLQQQFITAPLLVHNQGAVFRFFTQSQRKAQLLVAGQFNLLLQLLYGVHV